MVRRVRVAAAARASDAMCVALALEFFGATSRLGRKTLGKI
jgi:hypothetical protein